LRDVHQRVNDAGAEIVIVGSGSPAQAGRFIEDYDVPMPVFADPSLSVYKAVGAKRGWWSTLNPRVLLNGARAVRAGFRQTRYAGVADQQGGVLVIRPDGSVPYAYLSNEAGDHPAPADVAAAVEAASRHQPRTD
jgi:hypothetical protein